MNKILNSEVFAMKKFLSVVFVLLMVVSASAEVISFPSAKVTIDVAAGWEYSDDGKGTAILVAGDKSASISFTKVPAEGLTLDQWATELSKQHKGTTPTKAGDSAMTYTFNGGKTTVIVGISDGSAGILSVTGEHADIGDMVNSIEDMD